MGLTNYKEKTIGEMYEQKQKAIQKMAMNKDESIDRAGRLTNATNLVVAFPDNWREKIKEIAECAREMGKMKEDNFISGLHGGIKPEKVDERTAQNRLHEDDYPPAEPF